MRTSITLAALAVLMALGGQPLFAGDIPESLLWSDDAQIFFARVLECRADEAGLSVTATPLATVKGAVQEGVQKVYRPNTIGDFTIREGRVYLFTYYDQANYTDIFEVTSYDTRTLRLKHVEGAMWRRFEQYLNDGEYGQAKVEEPGQSAPGVVVGVAIGALAAGLVAAYSAAGRKAP